MRNFFRFLVSAFFVCHYFLAESQAIVRIQRLFYNNNKNFIQATGGTIVDIGDYRYHFFDASTPVKKFNVTYVNSRFNNSVRVGMVGAGGGGGGQNGGSGAGAGRVIDVSGHVISVGSYQVIIGTKGFGASTNTLAATSGGNSYFDGLIARGGGGGASGGSSFGNHGKIGGSGSGAVRAGVAGVDYDGPGGGYGNDGGTGLDAGVYGTGGGGGSGGAGQNGTALINGAGGNGTVSTMSGASFTYAGGGGGGCTDNTGTPGLGGTGGGGNGGTLTGVSATGYGSGGGGGGTNGGNGSDGVLYISYPIRSVVVTATPAPTGITNKIIWGFNGNNTRYDQSCCIRLQNGNYLLAVSRYLTHPDDYQKAEIAFYTSTDLSNSWEFTSVIGDLGNLCSHMPNLQQRADGTIVCVFLNLTTAPYGRIVQKNSSDNGLTWGSTIVVRSNPTEQLDFAPREITVTNTGRWTFCFGVGEFVTPPIVARGFNYYSDDEGVNWTLSTDTIDSPDGRCFESGIVTDNSGDLCRYFRSFTNGVLYACTSTNNAVSWGAVSDIGVNAGNSTTTIIKIPSGKYVAIYNPSSDRLTMKTAVSTALYSGWTLTNTIRTEAVKQSIEPFAIVIGSNLYVNYSFSGEDGGVATAYFDLYRAKIPLTDY